MLSKPLLKKTIRDSWKLWAIITGVLMFFIFLLLKVEEGMAKAATGGGSMAGGILNQFYSMFGVILPLIYILITANKLIAAKVDNGSLGYIMANPVKRNQVTFTQCLYLICSIIAMIALVTLTGLITITAGGLDIEIGSYLLLNLGVLLLLLANSGISFFASCAFNRNGISLAIGAGIPIAFFLFETLSSFSSMAKIMEIFKYITLNTLYSLEDVFAYSTNMYWQFSILLAVAATLYIAGIVYFKKKDLPL